MGVVMALAPEGFDSRIALASCDSLAQAILYARAQATSRLISQWFAKPFDVFIIAALLKILSV
jgi:hypothetical protein